MSKDNKDSSKKGYKPVVTHGHQPVAQGKPPAKKPPANPPKKVVSGKKGQDA